ncbi:AGE family epimerase/isomerase [Rhizobium sp. RU35A]|uniref:AGE family epimerase/isomerase n=1 Tax=Rhizobium sp. RU35A TaxID=1907414 RepID=UPI00122C2F9D|nr:AGE family epimerase/isomerase [Rhizobium sp. RU35A]
MTYEKLSAASKELSRWLDEDALPLWRDRGFHGEAGGFSETVTLGGQPTDAHRRARVHPRQVYCFAEAGVRGWTGDWQTPVQAGLAFFDRVYRLDSGFYAALADKDGQLLDTSFDLYNQAFAILSFVYTARVYPERQAEMAARTSAMLASLKAGYAHPEAGFEEDNPARLPLCSNPHMHLFEASLACEAAEGFDATAWTAFSDEIAALCMRRFIDGENGGLREFFNHDWSPFDGEKGRIMEPGHQFEWAWLLARWGERRGNAEALAKARRLFEIGETHGICATRKVAVMTLLDDFSVADPLARLWPQTEWIKSAARLAVLSQGLERERYVQSALAACAALSLFLDTPLAGLWRDKMKGDGSFIEEAAPASSFYHILCAIYELEDCLAALDRASGVAV